MARSWYSLSRLHLHPRPVPVSRYPKEESPHDTPSSQLNMGPTAPLRSQRIKGCPSYNDMWSICATAAVSVVGGWPKTPKPETKKNKLPPAPKAMTEKPIAGVINYPVIFLSIREMSLKKKQTCLLVPLWCFGKQTN